MCRLITIDRGENAPKDPCKLEEGQVIPETIHDYLTKYLTIDNINNIKVIYKGPSKGKYCNIYLYISCDIWFCYYIGPNLDTEIYNTSYDTMFDGQDHLDTLRIIEDVKVGYNSRHYTIGDCTSLYEFLCFDPESCGDTSNTIIKESYYETLSLVIKYMCPEIECCVHPYVDYRELKSPVLWKLRNKHYFKPATEHLKKLIRDLDN